MKQNFFAVDLGATSGRTILSSFTKNGINLEEVSRFPNHLIEVGGHFYWDIYALYSHIIDGLKKVAQLGEPITSIGIDTWGVDFVLLGKDGNLLRQPYSYRDPHTVGAPEALFSRISRSEVYGKTGIQVMNFNSLFQLDTLRRNKDSALEAADKILFMPDALSYMLTGEMVTEYTIASTAQLVNAHTQRLEPELLKAVGLTEKNFGRFVFPGEQIGVLTEEVQKMTGLGPIPVIAVAGHDTGSAVASVPALDRNFAYLSSGTWSLMGVETDAPVINAETEALNFTNEGGVEGTIRLLKNICGMWLLERCRLNWGETSYPELISEADSCEPFRSLINPDDACFANPADMEKAIIEYCHATGQPAPEQRGQIVRCIFESLALRYRQVLENLRALSPRPIETLHVIGGGSRNDLLNQFTANAIGIPVVAGPSEATAIGNVMIQAMAAGEATDVAGMRQLINRSIPLKTYQPQDMEAWDAAYIHFKNCVR
ncbi:rhamnulokinase [Bacteroides thetaiotaomicron]|uniref:rhamnulokinase n=1 Tax=Bacteroides thetaiotaomicron TaxID=818 RepID=UPI0021664B72|nr:rhamnulokinase [Bacteroides thetaiotaomicron]MCS3195420.1 rhamnulokinase [Bacteroides thetaiotaomicron]